MNLDIKKKTSTTNTTVSKNRKIEYIVIHYTAGVSSTKGKAASTATYFSKETTKASADFIVDNETIVQFNPDIKNRYTWHCGGSKLKTKGGSFHNKCTNKNSIGIEICSTNRNGKIENANDPSWCFTYGVIKKAEELVAYLIEEYGIPAENIIRHYDVTGKLCPGIIGWNAESGDESEWYDFLDSVSNTLYTEYYINSYEQMENNLKAIKQQYNELKEKYDAIVKIVNG
jgi:N-acetylmuramoyl-L-alanine amidase CwlA